MNTKAKRPLTGQEQEIILWLLQHASVSGPLDHLISQVHSLQVLEDCGCVCGCPSLQFVSPENEKGVKRLADAIGTLPCGANAGLILWGRDNEISSLEVYGLGIEGEFSLVQISDLKPWKIGE